MEKRQHKQKAVLMTEGPIWRCLLLFALPLMAGNLFQQLYNTVDSIVVGNFVGKEALAAVGSTDSVINTFIGFFSGMSTGAGVIISQYYGGKKEEKVSIAVQTTIALTLCMSILCTVLALLLVPSLRASWALRMMSFLRLQPIFAFTLSVSPDFCSITWVPAFFARSEIPDVRSIF